MATLTANISASASQIDVTGDVSGARTTAEYRIDDEIITLRKFARELFGVPNPWGQLNRSKWVVSRGVNGTTAASHLAGAEIVGVEDAVTTGETLTPPEPFAGEGGAPAAIFYSDVDPGAVGAGALWLQDLESVYGDAATQLWVRNADDDGWAPASPPTALFPNGFAIFTALSDGAEIDVSDVGKISMAAPTGYRFRTAGASFGEAATTDLVHGTVDPSAGAGVDMNPGSILIRNNASTRELWFKTGDADTAWTKII